MPLSHSSNRYAGIRDRFRTRCFEPSRSDRKILDAVNRYSDSLRAENEKHLRRQTLELRAKVSDGVAVTADEILIPALALAKQSLVRTAQMSAYDVQILAGIAMCHGAIAEMQTGEGKTLASVFPIVVHALTGKGVHVATVNAYLAERDFEFIRPALHLLGLTAGISKDGASTAKKRAAYECDVTYATGYELGFDFLRDQISLMSRGPERLGAKLRRDLFSFTESGPVEIQRGHALAIIDEVDSVLIDEAITPLVLSSGGLDKLTDESIYHAAAQAAAALEIETDFFIDTKAKALFLTELGSRKAHALLDATIQESRAGSRQPLESALHSTAVKSQKPQMVRQDDDIRASFNMLADLERAEQWSGSIRPSALVRPWKDYVESALRAQHIMMRDINYVVRDGKVEIVDEYTGRIFSDRNWRDGLHQAVEEKEGVPITEEKRTLARISRQRYFQRYEMLCGMTGTVSGHQQELLSCYRLPIVVIPVRNESQRNELPPRYFSSENAKIDAIVTDVKKRNRNSQPVLVGTRTIEQSIRLSQRLSDERVQHDVLNGVQDAPEATLVSTAGWYGRVTVATNMAGRGTDIKPNQAALESGGLHVIGLERNHSRRIDRQLLGRAGRQGDPGSGQFFISADDEIIHLYDPGLSIVLSRLDRHQEGQPNRGFDQRIDKIQDMAERKSYQLRCHVMKEELWLDNIKKAVS